MSQDDFMQIKLDNHAVGITGLKTAMEEMANEYAERPDDEVGAEFLKRLSGKNYIPDRVKANYAKAFLREFKKFLGKPYDEEASRVLEIKVLGQGCVQCDRLTKELMDVMAEINLSADLEHVKDIKEIGKFGVMGMPALILNGKVMSVGRVPPKAKLKEWLSEFV